MKINEYLELYFSVYPQKYPHFKCHTPCFDQISVVCLPWLYLAQNKIIGRFGEVWQLVAVGNLGAGFGLVVRLEAGRGCRGLVPRWRDLEAAAGRQQVPRSGGMSCGGICQDGRSSPGTGAFGWWWRGLAAGGSREPRRGVWPGGMAGGWVQGRRPAGFSCGLVAWWCDSAAAAGVRSGGICRDGRP